VSHYKSNVRDQIFNLFEVLGVDKALGQGEYSDLDADTVHEMLTERAVWPKGRSRLRSSRRPQPAGFRPEDALRDTAGGVQEVGARVSRSWLGQGRSRRDPRRHADAQGTGVGAAGAHSGREPRGVDVRRGVGFANIVYHLGTEEQKKWAVLAADGGWGATMVLTEPDAGSDVGAGRTKAIQTGRRFVAHRRGQAVHHLRRLRRPVRQHHPPGAGPPEGAGPGTKGLSLFFVPKFLFDFETGEIASVTARSSPTSSTRWV